MSTPTNTDPGTTSPKPTLEQLVGGIPFDVLKGLFGGSRAWYVSLLTKNLSETLGETVTEAQLFAAVKAVNASNTAAGQPNTQRPAWIKPAAKKGTQAADQIAKRFGTAS